MSKHASALSRHEEAEMGRRIQACLAQARQQLYETVLRDREILAKRRARPEQRRAAQARRDRFAYGGKRYRQLRDHLWQLSQSVDHGFEILRRFGPPDAGALADRFVEANEGLAVTIARQFARLRFLPVDEMEQVGRIGLCIAVLRFDPGIGKFSSFAHWWIKHFIKREIADHGRLIRLPVSVVTLLGDVEWSRRRLEQKFGRTARLEEIAKDLKRKPARLIEVVPHLALALSLDAPIDRVEHGSLHDIVASFGDPPDAGLAQRQVAASVQAQLARLPPMEQDIVVCRLGLRTDRRVRNLAQLGKRYDCSGETIRKTYFRALDKLKRWLGPDLGLAA